MTIKPVPGTASTLPYMLVLDFSAITMTDDEFVTFCCNNGDLRFEMTANRELIIMPPEGMETGAGNLTIGRRLGNWTELDGTGIAFGSSAGFTLPKGSMKAADACWILRERWDALSQDEKRRFSHISPDFVIELRSESDSLRHLLEKMEEYIENGVRLGWLIDPRQRRVYIYRPSETVQVLEDPATVSGDPELPGFTLDLREIWGPVGG